MLLGINSPRGFLLHQATAAEKCSRGPSSAFELQTWCCSAPFLRLLTAILMNGSLKSYTIGTVWECLCPEPLHCLLRAGIQCLGSSGFFFLFVVFFCCFFNCRWKRGFCRPVSIQFPRRKKILAQRRTIGCCKIKTSVWPRILWFAAIKIKVDSCAQILPLKDHLCLTFDQAYSRFTKTPIYVLLGSFITFNKELLQYS